MDQFPSAAHLCSWAGLAPGNNESAGKRKSGKTTKGNKKLRTTLVARGAARSKNTYLSSRYHRIAARRGANRAAVAVAHRILTICFRLLKYKVGYVELGPNDYEERKRKQVAKQTVRKLESPDYKVTIEQTPQTA